jgi:hypothetical protein
MMISSLIVSLLKYWPHDELVHAKNLIDEELKRRTKNDVDEDTCQGCHNCCVRDDTDEDDDGAEDQQVSESVPGTTKENFYDVWLDFNDYITSRTQQIRALYEVADTLDLTVKEEEMIVKNLDQDREERLLNRIVRFPILNQGQLDRLRDVHGHDAFEITFSLITD